MGRRPRIHFDGATFHAWARGVDRRRIYADDTDYGHFMECLTRVLRQSSARLVAHCLMPNHFHLLIQVSGIRLSVIMQRVLTNYASYFNRRHDRVGHLFQERFRERLCADNDYLSRIIPYIHLNPVRARLVDSPEKWRWSSQIDHPISEIDLTGFDPWEGSEERMIDLSRKDCSTPKSIEDIAREVALTSGISVDLIQSGRKSRAAVAARREAAILALEQGYSLTETARGLKISLSAVGRFRPGESVNRKT